MERNFIINPGHPDAARIRVMPSFNVSGTAGSSGHRNRSFHTEGKEDTEVTTTICSPRSRHASLGTNGVYATSVSSVPLW